MNVLGVCYLDKLVWTNVTYNIIVLYLEVCYVDELVSTNIMYNTSIISCDVICWKISWYEYNVSHKYYGLGWQCWKIPNKTAILGFMLKIQNNSNCFNYIFWHCHRFQFITRGTLWIPTVQQELPTVPEHLNSIPFLSGFVLITL